MIPCKPNCKLLALVVFIFTAFSFNAANAQDGKALFNARCAGCHNVFQKVTGPALMGLEDRGPWGDRKNLVEWIHNPTGFAAKNAYAKDLIAQFNPIVMSANPDLSEKDIDAIVTYINDEVAKSKETPKPVEGAQPADSKNWLIFGIISIIMAVIALILMQVNSNLKKLSDDAEGIIRPDPVPFYKNKVYISLFAIVLFVIGGYGVTKGAIGLGRQKNYEPRQPIFYSHKVHAGINQISCLYCHGNAWESKLAAVPSVNVCMNCHKTIQEYKKGPELVDAEGNKINGTAEIQKLYQYAGFDPNNASAWDASKAKPIEWIKIHNLPDHVYFNHSQHIRAGKVQCQTCHGPITEMDEVKQFSELSMGWCINCHRETKVDFNKDSTSGNKFYSIYEKFHNDIKNHKMDSVTVKDIGGLECQKCHY